MTNFYDPDQGSFYLADRATSTLIVPAKDLFDHVTPSANALMAHNLWTLGHLLNDQSYVENATQMIQNTTSTLLENPAEMGYWGSLHRLLVTPVTTVAIVGDQCQAAAQSLRRATIVPLLIAGTKKESNLPLLMNKPHNKEETLFYLCQGKHCFPPTLELNDIIAHVTPR